MLAEAYGGEFGEGGRARRGLEAVQEGGLVILCQHVQQRHAACRQQLRGACAPGFTTFGV